MFGAAKRAHHRAQEEMRRQNEINNFNDSQRRAQSALEDQMRQAREREAKFEQQNRVLMQQLQEMTIQNKEAIANQQSFYEGQLAQTQAASEAQIASLNDLMIQQKSGFDQQYGLLQEQKLASDAAFAEQQRIARNIGNAFVPQAQATAAAPVSGAEASNTINSRKAKNNELSQLSIVSRPATGGGAAGLGGQLAGLQIA
jgi:hypothetical protein